MTQRKYTVDEIDDLRAALNNNFLFGCCYPDFSVPGGLMSRVHSKNDKSNTVENQLRTHMFAGHTAEDLKGADTERSAAIFGNRK